MAQATSEKIAVSMEDGRTIEFGVKQRVIKDVLIDESKIKVDDQGGVYIAAGAVKLRMDFKHGATRTFSPPASLVAQFAGHGMSQKYGDELATTKDKPLTDDDMTLAVEDLDAQIQKGSWKAVSEGGSGGVSGASVVVKALVEVSGKPVEVVKAFLQGKLDAAKVRGEKLSRKELYDSFRDPNSSVGKVVARLEEEARAKSRPAVDAEAEVAALMGS